MKNLKNTINSFIVNFPAIEPNTTIKSLDMDLATFNEDKNDFSSGSSLFLCDMYEIDLEDEYLKAAKEFTHFKKVCIDNLIKIKDIRLDQLKNVTFNLSLSEMFVRENNGETTSYSTDALLLMMDNCVLPKTQSIFKTEKESDNESENQRKLKELSLLFLTNGESIPVTSIKKILDS